MASGIRSKSKCVAGEEVRVGRSDHIGDFQAGSIESGYRFVMCIQNLMLSVRDQAAVGAEEVRLKLQSVVLLAVDRFQIAAIFQEHRIVLKFAGLVVLGDRCFKVLGRNVDLLSQFSNTVGFFETESIPLVMQ